MLFMCNNFLTSILQVVKVKKKIIHIRVLFCADNFCFIYYYFLLLRNGYYKWWVNKCNTFCKDLSCWRVYYLFLGSGVSCLAHFDGSGLEQGVVNVVRHVQDLSMNVPEGRYVKKVCLIFFMLILF